MYSRREFLKSSSASLIALAGASSPLFVPFSAMAENGMAEAAPKGRELILICDTDHELPVHGQYNPVSGRICVVDAKSGDVDFIQTPFYGHTVDQNPLHPEQAVSLQKWGTMGALFNLKTKSTINFIHAINSYMFFGHGLFSPDGKSFICAEQNINEKGGQLVVRSVPDMKVIGQMSAYGDDPHECHSFDGGKTIMVANNRNPDGVGSVTWIDPISGKLVRKISFSAQNFAPSHMDLSHDGWYCLGGKQYKSTNTKDAADLISFISPSGEVFAPKIPDDISRRVYEEALSVKFMGKTGMVAITVPQSDLVLIMDYKKQTLVEALDLEIPKGVLYKVDGKGEQSGLIISLAKKNEMVRVQYSKHKKSTVNPIFKSFQANGSHIAQIFV